MSHIPSRQKELQSSICRMLGIDQRQLVAATEHFRQAYPAPIPFKDATNILFWAAFKFEIAYSNTPAPRFAWVARQDIDELEV